MSLFIQLILHCCTKDKRLRVVKITKILKLLSRGEERQVLQPADQEVTK